MTMPKISPKDGFNQATSSATTRPSNGEVPTSIDCNNHQVQGVEPSRRSSMASSIGDNADYQNPSDSYTASPFQRRASGPSNKPTIDRKTKAQLPSLRRDDSWGNLSIEDML